jgi:3-phosphoshikimate 1-carboxyvinyltransferase
VEDREPIAPAWPDQIEIAPSGPLRGTVSPPGSKSITNRALICAALADGESKLCRALDSEDTRVMIDALRALSFQVVSDPAASAVLVKGGSGRIPAPSADLYVANSGTSMRFLAPLVALGKGRFRLDGTPRMHERPMGDLLEALEGLGAHAWSEAGNGCPPVVIEADGLEGGEATVRGDVSSQFLSGLLMSAPYARTPVELTVAGSLVSRPYVDMTLAVMSAFGVDVINHEGRFGFPVGQRYRGREYTIEPDASAASYFFGAAAIVGGQVTVPGLSRTSLQGDIQFLDILEQMGCRVEYGPDRVTVVGPSALSAIETDMNAISDTVPTLAAVSLFARGATEIRGVAHIRHKETDRIRALATELRKLGAQVDEHEDGLTIHPGALGGVAIETYDDHRMAMSMALVGLRVPGVVITNPACTAKTYPRFFDDLRALVRHSPIPPIA